MKKTLLAAVAFACLAASGASAAPLSVVNADRLAGAAPAEHVRTYCYNTRTGAFRHWGPCTNLFRVCDWRGCYLQRRYW